MSPNWRSCSRLHPSPGPGPFRPRLRRTSDPDSRAPASESCPRRPGARARSRVNGAIVIRLSSTAKTPANSSGASASIVARAASTAIVRDWCGSCWNTSATSDCVGAMLAAPRVASGSPGPALGAADMWDSKLMMRWGTPSSRTSKSASVRSCTGLPVRSRTMTSTTAAVVDVWKTGRSWGFCAAGVEMASPIARPPAIAPACRRLFMDRFLEQRRWQRGSIV